MQEIDIYNGLGIIPAYAGSTRWRRRSWPDNSDHPRIRGEHPVHTRKGWVSVGSSPHTRGAPGPACRPIRGRRIIPAYAGSTVAMVSRETPCRDHPRIRGEHVPVAQRGYLPEGSSPHTRGAREDAAWVEGAGGIIPAYAGSTNPSHIRVTSFPDHPRIRGEHVICRGDPPELRGSSPHTRGALSMRSAYSIQSRIIPAYAGSTPDASPRRTPRSDHPRIRGEHLTKAGSARVRVGSSPHTRGALLHHQQRRDRRRIIPAYAGSTHQPASADPLGDGSSPHTRGARPPV